MEKLTRKTAPCHIDNLLDKKDYVKALDIVRRYRTKGYTITRTTAIKEHNLNIEQLSKLNSLEVRNPHFSTASPMVLYLKQEINNYFN